MALQHDLFPSDLSDEVLQVQSQIFDLSKRLMDTRQRINDLEAGLVSDTLELESARRDLECESTATVNLPDGAVIWTVDVSPGMTVGKGDKILSYLDRHNLMVEIAIDDSTLELIHPGHPVRIRLFGIERSIHAEVISVTGSAAVKSDERFAAGLMGRSVREGRILARIKDPELAGDVGRFCGVGRTAYAEFQGIGLMEQYLRPFVR